MNFPLGPGAECNLDTLVDTRLLIQANSGGGKSWCLRRILEQTFGHVQHLVIDPEGEFASLRERYDYVLAAKQGGDTAADPRVAKLLAQRLLELGASAILDIYELKARERVYFVRYFLEALVDAPKNLWHPALVVIDEAHVYCPQKGEAESAGAVIDLATRGRKRGFSAVLATQRLSKLHKDAAAECNNKLIGRTGLDVDMARAGEELGFVGREERLTLRRLAPGQFYAFGPSISDSVELIEVGPVETRHPKAGSRIAFTPPPPTEKVKRLLPSLSDLPAEAEEERQTVESLKRDNADLRRKLTIVQKSAPPPSEELIDKHVQAAVAKERREQEREAAADRKRTDSLTRVVGETADTLSGLADRLRKAVNDGIPEEGRPRPSLPPIPGPPHRPERESTPPPAPPRAPEPEGPITGSQQRILDALRWWEAVGVEAPSKSQVGYIAGYRVSKRGGGTFANLLGALRSGGFIDYPSPGTCSLTERGRDAAQSPDVWPTLEALHGAIFARLNGSEERVLKAVIGAYPDDLSKQEAGSQAGYRVSEKGGGTFANILGRLRSLDLIDYPTPGRVSATRLLFPESLS